METLFIYKGKVISGRKRGRNLGFPTANISLHKKISEGVYVSKVIISGTKYEAATFVGKAKTYNENDYKSESYILDFNKDIYNQWISVHLFKKIRENLKFNSEKELVDQIKLDVINTREFFSSSNIVDSNQK